MELLVVGFGSNLGIRDENLAQARQMMNEIWELPQFSRVFQTTPWGVAEQPLFLNQVGMGYTLYSPLEILAKVKDFERKIGRVEGPRYGPRVIDIDILYYSDWVLVSDIFSIPHPRLHERAFALVPLVEILPDWIHPLKMKSHKQLLSILGPEESACRLYDESTTSINAREGGISS